MPVRPHASTRARHLTVQGIAIAAVASCLGLAVGVAPAGAAPVVTASPTAIPYTEQAPPVSIGSGVTVTSGGNYGGGYLDFTVAGGTAADALSLLTVATPDITSGVVSIVGSTVYVGTGTRADVVGTVNPTRNGSNGALRVDLATQFTNPSFEDGASIAGWTLLQNRIDLGVTPIAGFASVDNSTYFPGQPGQPTNDDVAPLSATYSVTRNSAQHTEGSYSLQLTSDMQTARGCDVVHGPAVYSQPFSATQGDTIGFDWQAYQGSDDYHVFGYILNVDTGAQTTVLDATGSNTNAWVSKNTTVPASGKYRFVFVAGTHDLTCGQAAGATLLLDNVRVQGSSQAQASDAVLTQIAHLVQYANTSDNPQAARTVNVTATDQSGTSNVASISVAITAVDDPPVFSAIPGITLINTEAAQTFAPSGGTLPVTDPDSPGIQYSIVGGTADPATVNGVAYTHSIAGRYGVLRVNASTGAYVYVPDSAAVDARLTNDSESFTFAISAPDLSPGGPHPAKTAQQNLTVNVAVPASGPGAPTATQATAGIRTADVSWTAPTWIGGSPLTGYRVQVSTDNGATWITAITDTRSLATTAHLAGFAPGTPIRVRVAGLNANGAGPYGADSGAITPYDVPAAPTAVQTVPTDQRLDLSWTAPATDNGRAITGYRVEKSTDGGATWTVAIADTQSSTPSAALTGLTNGAPVTVRVSAINLAGAGPASATAVGTPRTVPGAPRALVATPSDGQVQLAWNAPSDDGGDAVSGYRIETSADGGATWTTLVADTGSTATTATVTGLVNGTPASYRVSAINAAGAGAPGVPADATPRTAATAPTIQSIEAHNRTLLVTFTAPSSDGGAAITGYEYSVDGGTTWQPASGTTSPLRLTGLSNGQDYPVQLRAVNAAGPGAASASETSAPVLEPVRTEANGTRTLPSESNGTASSSTNGAAGSATVTPDNGAIVVTTAGGTLRIESLDAAGAVVRADGTTLHAVRGGSLRITGSGYRPNSTVDLWLLRSGILLDGNVPVGADGTFSRTFAVAGSALLGSDTLQVNGVSPAGAVLSTAVGVDIVTPSAAEQLAFTGSDATGGLLAALALLVAGTGLVLARRIRRRA